MAGSRDSLVVRDTATPELQRLARKVRDKRGLLRVLGRTLANELKDHYRHKDRTEPNRLGGQRTHYWREVADSVHAGNPSRDSIAVNIGHPTISQKVYGGTIYPKRAKALTIPMHPDGHGRHASEVPGDLFVYRDDAGKGYLARAENGGLEIIYALRSSVTQDPDPTALPDLKKIGVKFERIARDFLRRETR